MWDADNPPIIQPTDSPPPGNTTFVANKSSSGNKGKIIAALLGVFLLVAGVAAGLFLVNQQQLINQKAAAGEYCTGIVTCTSGGQTTSLACNGFSDKDSCQSAASNESSRLGSGATCQSSCNWVTSQTNDNFNCGGVGIICKTGTTCVGGSCVATTGGSPSGGGTPTQTSTPSSGGSATGGGGTGTTSTTTTTSTAQNLKAAGQACTADSDCAPTAGGKYKTICNANKVCANPNCPNDTNPGDNYDCKTATQTCGQPCGDQGTAGGGLFPLCVSGSACGPLGAQCSLTGTYCLPSSPSGGYTFKACSGSNTAYSYLVNSSGAAATTQAQVQAACNTATVAEASSTPTATPTSSPAAGSASTPTPTQKPIPVTGFDTPTIMGLGIGIFLTLTSLILIF